jgi:transcriptional regulator with XRE-family HTH domain
MTTTESKAPPRPLTPRELAGLIRTFREMRQWSQETLAALSGLSVRTIQRAEKGESSDFDTRRALAGAFDSEDLDLFNKPWNIQTPEALKSAQEEFEREHLILDTAVVATGRELAALFEGASMDISNPAIDLNREPAGEFAALVDYLRDYRDCADLHSEVQKLEVHADLQRHLEALDAADISVCYATRNTNLVGANWQDKTPWPVKVVYLSAFHKGKVPNKIAVSRNVGLG